MSAMPCPHCKAETISWMQKYKAAKWAISRCPDCNGRLCSNPYILVIYTMLYAWDVLLFGFLAVLDHNPWYWLVMVVGWLILDWFSLYLPLSALRAKKAEPNPSAE